ncbi:DNA-binding transcriptional regulator [Bacteroides sp. GD17]|jgi:LacI family transcriptional regulator|uniref:AraC family transcriptional regulator n=1 Tax=Bacteroides sp. GD17 TaxID=3139826 RepID=UPI0025D71E2F|nr:DNA-binding transcriptional regulator [uncultured Bacteroides sp.]
MVRLILLTDFTEAFAHNLLRGILEYSKGREPWVVCRMPPSYKQSYGIPGVLEWAKKWQADAIIAQFNDNDEVELFRENGIVALAQDFQSRFSVIPNITSRYELTGQMAADFFLQKGFRNFAFYGYKDVVWSEERYMGFRNRIMEKGLGDNFFEYKNQPLENLWYYESEPLADWIKSLPHPVALMACDDTRGNKIMEMCQVLGINIPEEIAVLGVDNDEIICNLSEPPLSSVSLNIVKGGYEAARLIDRLIHNEATSCEDVIIQPITIVNRLSTDIYATDNPAILAALKYIHQNLANKINVEDIVKQVPLSRRLLEIRFRQVTGQSIYQYISDLRMERFSQLLLASTEPIADLAMQVGLADSKNLARQFKLWKGCTPVEYRKRNKVS